MKLSRLFICCLLSLTILVSCKDDTKKTEENVVAETTETSEETKKSEIKETHLTGVNTVLGKIMATPETKSFMRYVLSANIMDKLSDSETPHTLIVPSNAAFEKLPEESIAFLAHTNNRETLTTLLKNHMVEGDLSSAELLQLIKKKGTHTLHTMGGANLMAYLEGNDIMIKDSDGVVAKLGKSDILADNGKVHIIDVVLNAGPLN